MLKIATWNLCLGLFNKKDYVYQVIKEEKIDICLLQEIKLDTNIPSNLVSSKNYKIEVEQATKKARCEPSRGG